METLIHSENDQRTGRLPVRISMEAKIAIYCAPHSFLKLVRIRFFTFSGRIYHTPCEGQDIEGSFFFIAAIGGVGPAEDLQ